MRISLISDDQHTYAICHEILTRQFGPDASLVVCNGDVPAPGSDLCIWDFRAGAGLPQNRGKHRCQHLFLVHRDDLECFAGREQHGAQIILKPITPAILEIFLVEAKRAAGGAGCGDQVDGSHDHQLRCLSQTNLKVQQYDQERTNFLARATHDFQAPLTALTGYCGLLLEGELGAINEAQEEVLRRIRQSAVRLSRMAAAMFQLSVSGRVEARLNRRAADLRECVAQAIHEIMPAAEEKRIQVSVQCDPAAETLYFDPSLMEQVLVNLLDNACRHTPAEGKIHVRGCGYFWDRRLAVAPPPSSVERRWRDVRVANAYRIDVQDSGPGISGEQLNRIFEEYVSAERAGNRSGAGLGLAICKLIVQQHQGRIWAESNGRGARFSVVLPAGGAEMKATCDFTAEIPLTGPGGAEPRL